MATIINYNDTTFRALFPAYANTTAYPQVALQAYWDSATSYVSNVNAPCPFGSLSLSQQTFALNLMTAHLVYLAGVIAAGQVPSIETGASIDKISVSLEPPPVENSWQYWLSSSPYGLQLLALLKSASAGGFYVKSGLSGRSGFRGGVRW